MDKLEQLLKQTIDKNGFVGLPILTHVEGNLYVGISPAYWEGGGWDIFSTIFDYFSEMMYEQYEVVAPQQRITYKMLDGHALCSEEFLIKTADAINKARMSGMTLVHCQMGINRSNLFVVAALCRAGMKCDDAIRLLREKRSHYVLMNQHFELFLRATFP